MGFVSETVVKKPKKHYECYLCGRLIAGEHVKVFFVDDGKGYSRRSHIACHKKVQEMCADCDYWDDCMYDVAECFYEKLKDEAAK